MPASNSGCKHLYLDGARASAWRFSPLELGHLLLDAGSSTMRLFSRFPIAFGDEDLHGFEPLLPLRIVAIAHADEAVTVLREKLIPARWKTRGTQRPNSDTSAGRRTVI
jgi:hypothetical protein